MEFSEEAARLKEEGGMEYMPTKMGFKVCNFFFWQRDEYLDFDDLLKNCHIQRAVSYFCLFYKRIVEIADVKN